MRDLSNEILHYSRKFQLGCPQFGQKQECAREGGCVCSKMGEIYAHIHSFIKPEYRKASIYSFNGKLPDGTTAMESVRAKDVRKRIWTYLYGETPIASMTRPQMNAASVLDTRFAEGSSIIIHGDSYHMNKDDTGGYIKKHRPLGKTLLASIVMIDAIWRLSSPKNRAFAYDWVSFLQLKQMLKQKNRDELYDIQTADWLVIDDVDIIDNGRMERSAMWTKEVFDSFLMERLENRKPSIFVCNFDITSVSLADKMGAAFEKIALSSNTHVVKV